MQEQPDVDVVGGVDQLYGTTSSADKASDFVLNSLIGTGGARSTRGGGAARCHPKLWNMAVKRKTALRVARGPEDEPRVFDERLPVHGDIDLCIRIEKAGGRTLVTPEISVEHRREMDFKLFLKRNFQMARVSRLRGMHRLAHRVLSTAAVTEAVLLAASIGLPALRPLAFGLLALYGMVLLGGGVVAAIQKRDPAMMVLVPIVLAGLHASRAIGYLWPGTPGGNE
jgi:hypothetical protein